MINGHYWAILILLIAAGSASASAYSVSDDGLNFIANYEGIRYNLYNDPAGHCTIGVGHLVHRGNCKKCDGCDPTEQPFLKGLTKDQVLTLFRSDVADAEQTVNSLVTTPITQAQFDALVSFAYWAGYGNFKKSNVLSDLNSGNYDKVPEDLNQWTKSGGVVYPGLVTRRQDEGDLFQSEGLASGASKQVTLTLYVHDGSASGPIIPDSQVTGQDGSGNSFHQTTNSNGYATIKGGPGTWSFTASADGYETNSWTQPITETDSKDAFLLSSLGGINFTSIKLNYIAVNEDSSGNITFDYLFKAQKAEGTSPQVDFNDSTSLGLNAFMTGLAVDDYKFWVNLGPWEPDRIIDEQLSQSEVGRVMLEADLQMKRDFSNYGNPCASETGNALQNLLDKKREALTQQCMDKFPGEIKDIRNVWFKPVTRHWIVPDKVYAYTNGTQIFIINATLTINSEPVANHSSYQVNHQDNETLSKGCLDELNKLTNEYGEYYKDLTDRMILPYVIADVNHGEKYEDLREIYVSLALAQWYKTTVIPQKDIRDRVGSPKPASLKSLKSWSPDEIWDKYVYSFENGEYKCWQNETTKTATGNRTYSTIYSHGGIEFDNIRANLVEMGELPLDIQDLVKRAIMDGFINEGNDTFLGNRMHIGPRTLISGSSSESSQESPRIQNSNVNKTTIPENQPPTTNDLVAMQGDDGWKATFGGQSTDIGRSVQQTNDSGYIIAGLTSSYGNGDKDIWLIKTDSSGNKEWDKTFGGSEYDRASSVQKTNDGGYIIAGETTSYGAGGSDIWLVKTDSSGNKEWDKTFGTSNDDIAYSVQQTSDNGYVVVGSIGYFNGFEACLIKTDADGNKLWYKTFNGSSYAVGASVWQTDDGGYIIAGGRDGGTWLIKTDSLGSEEWNKIFSESGEGELKSVQQTKDGGYIIAGRFPGAYERDGYNVWLIKTDSQGNEEWNKTFGGPAEDYANSVQQTNDGGYIIAGITWSYGGGNMDAWLIKTDAEGNEVWSKVFGGVDEGKNADNLKTTVTQPADNIVTVSIPFGKMNSAAYSVQQTIDGGYILSGETSSYGPGSGENPFGGGGDVWLIKTDANGNV